MFAASKTAKAASAAAPTDPQFNYVTMLLHGNGTNGAQNNTFVDSSTNNFSITRNGNTTQGTFSPYGANWSNNFNGTTGYLTVPSSSLFKPGSSDFTIEAWVFVANTGVQQQVYGDCDSGTNNGICLLAISSGLKVEVDYFTSSTAVVTKLTTGSVQTNAWNHICVSKTGTTMYIGYNGTLETFTGIPSTMQSPSTIYPTIARLGAYNGLYVNGYISNFRYVIGSAVYTGSTYTVPTTPLTAISGTSILTCQSNRFIDNSTNALTITVNGSPSVQRFSPFNATSAYSTSVIGGSGYFDGTTDYLTVAANTAFVFGSGDFTVEAWIYPTSWPTDAFVISNLSNSDTSWAIEVYAGNIRFTGWATVWLSATQPSTGAWHHVAVSRSGTTLSMYVDGTRVATTTNSTNLSANNTLVVGDYIPAGGANFIGYISNARLVKGTAVYTGTSLTVPTAPLTAISGTSFLANFTNTGILDNAMMNDLETVGNAQISTSVKKYGTGSIYLDGSGDALYSTSQSTIFGTGNFTLEFWVYFNAVNNSTTKFLYDMRNSGATSASFLAQEADNTWTYWNGAGSAISSGFTSSTFAATTWTHVAICRSSGTTKFFVNGTQTSSVTDTSNYANSTLVVGARYNYVNELSAYIDDLRITKGYARYTSNFTPPTAAFPNN